MRVPACQQVGSIVQGEGGEPRAHQSQRRGRAQGSGCGKLAQVPPTAGTVYLATCAGAAGLRIIQGCFAHAPHSKGLPDANMREPAHPGGQTGDGRVLHCFQYIVEETLKQSWLVRDSACRGVCRGGLTHVGARYFAAGWESATLVCPLPNRLSRRVSPS